MTKLKVTQVRSIIKRPQIQKATIKALGLRRMNHSVVVDVTPQMLGMLEKVSHLIKVEEA